MVNVSVLVLDLNVRKSTFLTNWFLSDLRLTPILYSFFVLVIRGKVVVVGFSRISCRPYSMASKQGHYVHVATDGLNVDWVVGAGVDVDGVDTVGGRDVGSLAAVVFLFVGGGGGWLFLPWFYILKK